MSPHLFARISRAGLALALALGCEAGTSPPGPEAADETVAGRVAGVPITVAELDERIKEELFERATGGGDPSRVYELRSETLQRVIDDRLLEAKLGDRSISKEDFLAESAGEVTVDEAETKAFFEQNKARVGGRSFEEVEGQIRGFLEQRTRAERQREYVASLREGVEIEIALEPPRIDVEAVGASRGPEDAPITIVEFSDYECPYCKRAEPAIQQVLEKYGDKVRFVYRHYPLESIHRQAFGAAEAASCAGEQDRFWEYHEVLWEKAPAFGQDALLTYATEVGLDGERFKTCMDENRFQEQVRADLRAGEAAGVNGTPAFFVNGVMLSGARPFEEFERLIERELSSLGGGDAP